MNSRRVFVRQFYLGGQCGKVRESPNFKVTSLAEGQNCLNLRHKTTGDNGGILKLCGEIHGTRAMLVRYIRIGL